MSGVNYSFRSTTTIFPDSCWNLFFFFLLSLLLIPVVVVAVVMWKSATSISKVCGKVGKTVSPFFPRFPADRHFHGQLARAQLAALLSCAGSRFFLASSIR